MRNPGGHDGRACVERAFTGEPGPPCIGLTFLPDAAIDAVRWGASHSESMLSALCSRLRPDFAFVCSWEPDSRALCAEVASCGVAPLWVVRGAFDTVAERMGWPEAIRSSVADPAMILGGLDDAVREAREAVREGAECGAAGVVLAEDVAGARGPLLAPDFTLSELVPRLGAIAAQARAEGLPVVWHTDGDPRPYIAAAVRNGLDAIHPGGLTLERFGEVFEAARRGGLVVLGGIPGDVLREGGPAVIRAGVAAGVVSLGGGLLVCDDGGVTTGEELGMLVTALQAARSADST